MNNQLTIFNFDTASVRVVTINGQPWFVAQDVCVALGMSTYGGTRQWTKALDPDEQRVLRRGEGEFLSLFHGTSNRVSILSESGLYALIVRSNKPEAQRFRKWVTSEVLPAIRKDGMYVMGEEKVRTGEMTEDELVQKVMTMLQKKVERLTAENGQMRQEITTVTVHEFAALNHQYLRRGDASKLGKAATKLCRDRGIQISTQEREVHTPVGTILKTLNVYPAAVLYEAARLTNLRMNNIVGTYLQ